MNFTDTQRQIYDLLQSKKEIFQDEKGIFCIYFINDLAEDCGKSKRTVQRVLRELEEEKYIFRELYRKHNTQKIYLLRPTERLQSVLNGHDTEIDISDTEQSSQENVTSTIVSVSQENHEEQYAMLSPDRLADLSKIKIPNECFYNMPDSPASHMMFGVLASGKKDIDTISFRKKQVSYGTKYEVRAYENQRQIAMNNRSGNVQVTIEVNDIYKLSRAGKKLFILSLIKANEQSLFNGELIRDYVSFPLQELVDIGFYSTVYSARVGFEQGMKSFSGIMIKGSIRKSKHSTASIKTFEMPFTGGAISNSQCTIYLNSRIDWNFLVQYFTKLPKYYFKLSSRASDLLYYIFYLARQNTKKIADQGYFTISFRSIQNMLNLPSEIDNHEPSRSIRQPIENAIQEIEDEHKQMYNNTEFSLLPVCDEERTISDFLNNGYLKIIFDGSFALSFIEREQKKEDKLLKTEQQQQRIIEQSIAIKRAQAMIECVAEKNPPEDE